MNEENRSMLNAYYQEAASWNSDRMSAMRSSRRIAWMVAAGAAMIAMLEAASLAMLTPLKTVEPYTLLVDRTTGYVQALKPLDATTVGPDAALTQSFLVQYVLAREEFDIIAATANYRKVALFSTGAARRSYLESMQTSNPKSPLNAYPRGTLVEARVKSVSPVGRDAALVRFDTIRIDPNGRAQATRPWVALIRFRYSTEPMKLEDRFVNPLGFQVVQYRRDPEALPPQQQERTAFAQPDAVQEGAQLMPSRDSSVPAASAPLSGAIQGGQR